MLVNWRCPPHTTLGGAGGWGWVEGREELLLALALWLQESGLGEQGPRPRHASWGAGRGCQAQHAALWGLPRGTEWGPSGGKQPLTVPWRAFSLSEGKQTPPEAKNPLPVSGRGPGVLIT